MFCNKCGKILEDGAAFCTGCGARQNSGNSTDGFGRTTIVGSGFVGTESNGFENNQQPYGYQNNTNFDDSAMRMGAPHVGVSFGKAIGLFFTNYVNFKGRASKAEYWWVFLFNILLNIPIYFLSKIASPIGGLISLALIIPGLALYIRRLHDIGKPWYRMFIGLIPIAGVIIMIIDLCKDSDGDNKWGYGPNHIN